MIERTFITGFGPFGSIIENPSSKLAALARRPHKVLEVAYAAVDDFLSGLDGESFDRLLMLGLASGRDRITPELYARNVIGKSKDVRGKSRPGYIEAGSPLLLESTLWTPEVTSEIVAFDPLTKISMDAGTYLCNYIEYQALRRFPKKLVGFLHVPTEDRVSLDMQAASLGRILDIVER